jgi:hypothetical protein
MTDLVAHASCTPAARQPTKSWYPQARPACEDRWEVLRVWNGCKDDDQSSVFVTVNELLELVPTLTRRWLRSLLKDKASMSAAS